MNNNKQLIGIGVDQSMQGRTCHDQKMQEMWGLKGECKVSEPYRTCYDQKMQQKWMPKMSNCKEGYNSGNVSRHRSLTFDDPDNIYSYRIKYSNMMN